MTPAEKKLVEVLASVCTSAGYELHVLENGDEVEVIMLAKPGVELPIDPDWTGRFDKVKLN